jgi:hypothetical protein
MEPSLLRARRSACGNELALQRGSTPSCCPRTLLPFAGRRGDSREWSRVPARSPTRCVPAAASMSRRAPHLAWWHRNTHRHGPLALPADTCRLPQHLSNLSPLIPSAIQAQRDGTRGQIHTAARAAWRGGGPTGAPAGRGYPKCRPRARATTTTLGAHSHALRFRVWFPWCRWPSSDLWGVG